MFEKINTTKEQTESVEKRRLTPGLMLAAGMLIPTVTSGQETVNEGLNATDSGIESIESQETGGWVKILQEHFEQVDQERDAAFGEMKEVFSEINDLLIEYYTLDYGQESQERKNEIDTLLGEKIANFIAQAESIVGSYSDLSNRVSIAMAREGITEISSETLTDLTDTQEQLFLSAAEALESAKTDVHDASKLTMNLLAVSNLLIKPEAGYQAELKELLDNIEQS